MAQAGTIFKSDQPGNPKGGLRDSLDPLTTAFIDALYRDFEEHGDEAIRRVREENPVAYLQLIGELVPKQVEVSVKGDGAALFHVCAAEVYPTRTKNGA